MNENSELSVVIVGAGIIGLATAWQLLKQCPNVQITILEKGPAVAGQQTSHNSGVIHAGVYYPSGSLKSSLCQAGLIATKAYCKEHEIPVLDTSKLVVATTARELQRLKSLYQNCSNNKIETLWIARDELAQLEPNICGMAAIKVKDTAVTDYELIANDLAERLRCKGVSFHFEQEVKHIHTGRDSVTVYTEHLELSASQVICCAGANADRLMKTNGIEPSFAIIPFRGEFFTLRASCDDLVSHLIYPVPNPSLPFLGVHITRQLSGGMKVGPNALLAFDREGYERFSANGRDISDILTFPGFWKLSAKFATAGCKEIGFALSRSLYLKRVQKYCPSLSLDDFDQYKSGVRAQAVSRRGELIEDFMIEKHGRVLHVCNAPSPAATAAFPIADYILKQLEFA